MSEVKYTSDGRKVIVIGSLNSQEKIVQEIFIVDGSEIPSGEHFVVKSLHDKPAISWKEKELKALDERYEKYRKEYNDGIIKFDKELKDAYVTFKTKTNYLRSVINKVSLESFDTLVKFLTGEIKRAVKIGYSSEIIEFKDFRCDYDNQKAKLLTVFGEDDGTLTYGVNRYSDGSGSNSMYYLFDNKEDAIKKLSEHLTAKAKLNENDIIEANKYDIKLDSAKIEAWKIEAVNSINETISNSQKQILEAEKRKEKYIQLGNRKSN